MPTFAHPALLWGLALLSLPVLIHLINLVRQRHVPWAAMEFLLVSQRKNSSWIRFRELLLLALRMAAVAGVVLALAQPLLNHEIGFRFGRQKTHLIVLLDDSFSMSDRQSDTSAWDRGKQAIQQIGEDAALRSSPHSFTLLRYSRARGALGSRPDLLEESIDSGFGSRLGKLLGETPVSQLAVGPRPALEAAEKLLDSSAGDSVTLYLVTDFRTRDWDEPAELVRLLERLNQRNVRLQLIACAETRHANLAVAALQPDFGTRAAAVPVPMEIRVNNFSDEPARDVSIALEEDGVARAPVRFDEIPAGASQSQKFASYFATAGQHVVSARLVGDAVALDNARWHVLDLPLKVPALIIDGNADSREARFLATLFAPGGAVKTGIDPSIEPPSFLNDHPLDGYRSIYLLNVGRLDHVAVDALEKYVHAGGGLGIFMGDRPQVDFYNKQLYRNGQGFFPLPLAGATRLLVDRLDKAPDLEVTDHPVFKVFLLNGMKALDTVTVERFFAAMPGWKPARDSQTQIIARLRNGSPLAVEKIFGAGRVLAVMTTAGPVWNNWARDPSFVVAMLQMQAYLATRPGSGHDRVVGTPIEFKLDPARYERQMKLLPPEADPLGPRTLQATSGPQEMTVTIDEPDASGIYELQLTRMGSGVELRRWAVNVDADEGDLALLGSRELAERLEPVKYEYWQAGRFSGNRQELAGTDLTDWVLYLLIAILIGEQALAYVASYHPPAAERQGR